MLLLVDLDDTLIDRSGAFVRWAYEFCDSIGATIRDAQWIVDTDNGGNCPRPELASALISRFDLTIEVSEFMDTHMGNHLSSVRLYEGVWETLNAFKERGDRIVIVTNGLTERQLQKFRHVKLNELVDGIVVSQAANSSKPDSGIFTAALELVADALTGDASAIWMVGDNAHADIAGGQQLGFQTAWISHGRAPVAGVEPTLCAETPQEALQRVLELTAQ